MTWCRTAGEINTLQGNLNWVASREHSLTHPAWDGREADFLPLTSAASSDSANLDMLAEFLVSAKAEHVSGVCLQGMPLSEGKKPLSVISSF